MKFFSVIQKSFSHSSGILLSGCSYMIAVILSCLVKEYPIMSTFPDSLVVTMVRSGENRLPSIRKIEAKIRKLNTKR